MSQNKHSLAPEALGQRPDLSHNRYESGATPLDLDGVSVQFGTPTKPHIYNAPTGEGLTSRRLRRYALTISRYQLPETKHIAKRWKVKHATLKYVEQIIANRAYQLAFNDDPTNGTVNTKVLSLMLSEPSPNPDLIAKALSYVGTKAFDEILTGISVPEVADTLRSLHDSIVGFVKDGSWWWRRITQINSPDPRNRKQAMRAYREMARAIESNSQWARNKIEHDEQAKAIENNATMGKVEYDYQANGVPGFSDGTQRWYPLYVSKPELPLIHTGKLGRRMVYTDTGRVIKNISRLYSDPEERIFTRKTRSLGAVVIIDCSGSMGLDSDDLDQMIQASAGATILCYSSGGHPNEHRPNAWVVARKGRRVRQLPHFPGGNGCDAPALMYGITRLRESSRQPVIWISDEQVTGWKDHGSHALRAETDAIKQRYGVIVCPNAYTAIQTLRKLQGKG